MERNSGFADGHGKQEIASFLVRLKRLSARKEEWVTGIDLDKILQGVRFLAAHDPHFEDYADELFDLNNVAQTLAFCAPHLEQPEIRGELQFQLTGDESSKKKKR